jgi:hypothetical protein
MPLPVGYGATNTQYGTAYFDPLTGSYNQYSYGFDPSQMQAQWDAQSMYDSSWGPVVLRATWIRLTGRSRNCKTSMTR